MAPWIVVVCTAMAVSIPLIVGWSYSEARRRRELVQWTARFERLQAHVRVLDDDLAQATRRANALLAAFGDDRSDDALPGCLTELHGVLQGRTLELSALRRKHAGVLRELVELRGEVKRLSGVSDQTLGDNQEFQLHLAQVTDERDRLKAGLEATAPLHHRLQLKAAKDELEELRFKLRIANRAIVEMEGALDAIRRSDRQSGEITAPMLRPVSESAYTG